MEQNTYWFERQLIDTQLVGEFRFGNLSVDLRGTFANSQRESPYERAIGYFYLGDDNPATTQPDRRRRLCQQSRLGRPVRHDRVQRPQRECLCGRRRPRLPVRGRRPGHRLGGLCLYARPTARSSRFQFQYFRPDGALPLAVAQERPDFLLSDFNIYTFNIQLRDVSGAEGAAAYEADLRIHAGYAQIEVEPTDATCAPPCGVRYEDADQIGAADRQRARADPARQRLLAAGGDGDLELPARHAAPAARLQDDRPAAVPRARAANLPGFRIRPRVHRQSVPDRQRAAQFRGRATNGISRAASASRVAGFYKRIDNPIEAAAFFAGGGQLRTGFANAPQATLYGAEIEVQAYLPLASLGGAFFASRRLRPDRQLHLHPVARSAPTARSSSAPICSRSPPTSCSATARR